MKRALLVGPVIGSDRFLRGAIRRLGARPSDLVIGVDGGTARCLKAGLVPQYAVGDWDSLEDRRVLAGIPHLSLPQEKDASDLFHALRAAIEHGAREIICLGVTGGRPDHHLAALYEMMAVARGRDVRAIGEDGEYRFLAGREVSWSGAFSRGTLLSVFSLGAAVEGLALQGVKYPLRGVRLGPSSWGLSNVVTSGRVRIRFRRGNLVVVIPAKLG